MSNPYPKDKEIWKELTDKRYNANKVKSLKDKLDSGECKINSYADKLKALKDRHDPEGKETQAQFFHRILKKALGQDQDEITPIEDTMTTPALDAVSGIEKVKLAKELKTVRGGMAELSGIKKIAAIKRIGEIRVMFGVKQEEQDIKHEPIRIGDKFKTASGLWEVIGTKPGGKVELFDRKRVRFMDVYTKSMRDWERVESTVEPVIIATFKDLEDNIESRVAKVNGGYSVTLKDLDSGEVVPNASIYPDEASAIQKAKELAKVNNAEPEQTEITPVPATITDINAVMPLIQQFIGKSQLAAMGTGVRGEEGQFFKDKFIEVANVIKSMPKSYETDGQGDKAIAYLHYFKGGADWYITEKDAGDAEDEKEGISGQVQAFGFADLGYGGELGYISIKELIESGVELDLYWDAKSLAEIKGKENEPEAENTPVPVPSDSDLVDPLPGETEGQTIPNGEANGEGSQMEPVEEKTAFEAELNALKLETDIIAYDQKLDDLMARLTQAGLDQELDAELNSAIDQLTALLAEAEKS